MSFARAGLVTLVFVYLAVAAGLFLMQRRILYRPGGDRPDLARTGVTGVTPMTVPTEDGLNLMAWYRPARAGEPTVLYFHGNGGHLGHRAIRFDSFAAIGWGALMLEYRGYGGNPGSPSEEGLAADARAGLAALARLGIPPSRTLVWGESLGSGVAVRLASEHDVAALLLESPFTSITDIARMRYWFVPVRLLLRDRFESLAAIGRVRAPVLVMHGARDEVVPAAMGHAIHAAANEPKAIWIAPEGHHEDLRENGAFEAAANFVARFVR